MVNMRLSLSLVYIGLYCNRQKKKEYLYMITLRFRDVIQWSEFLCKNFHAE